MTTPATPELVQQAIGFYSHAPDGQYDEIAVQALRHFLAVLQAQPAAETALQKFVRLKVADEVRSPLEQLRSFCSFAMSGQDWIDCEPFFDAIVASAQPAAAGVSDAASALFEVWRRTEFAQRDGEFAHPDLSKYAADYQQAWAEVAKQARAILALRPQSTGETFDQWLKREQPAGAVSDMERGWNACAASLRSQAVPMTEEQRQQVSRDAVDRMMREINLSWRDAIVKCVEAHHGITAQGAQGEQA